MAKFRSFVFDLDGTLIDTEKTSLYSLHDTILEVMGEDRPLDTLGYYFSIPSGKVSYELGCKENQRFIDTWNRKWDEMKNLTGPFPGVLEFVKKVHSLGYIVGTVSSRIKSELYSDEHLAPVLDCFDVVVLAEDTINHKPSPEPMNLFIEKASALCGEKLSPEQFLYLGDTKADYGCCKNSGAVFALADWYKRGNQGMEPDFLIQTPEDLEKLLF